VPEVFLAVAKLVAETIPVRIAPDIKPVPCPSLPVLWTCQKVIDDNLVRPGIRSLGLGGRQADKIEIQASEKNSPLRFRLRFQRPVHQTGGKKGVHRIPVRDRVRKLGTLETLEGPMTAGIILAPLVRRGGSAGFDPRPNRLDLSGREGRGIERHALMRIARVQAGKKAAFLWSSGSDDEATLPSRPQSFGGVEAETGLLLEGSMAGITARLQDGFDLPEIV